MSGEGDDWGGSPGVAKVFDHGVACNHTDIFHGISSVKPYLSPTKIK